eukprot:TRINITY_DN1133_c0_g1_i4.p1 TRINITY_DN1133_c0_g1~~TRINITY_DN1133_c0_g1_i4.p1  ORF type:complete len:517 (-),score=102.55 TRINITY_DN1133_c0_g1_i4:918-2468(-)
MNTPQVPDEESTTEEEEETNNEKDEDDVETQVEKQKRLRESIQFLRQITIKFQEENINDIDSSWVPKNLLRNELIILNVEGLVFVLSEKRAFFVSLFLTNYQIILHSGPKDDTRRDKEWRIPLATIATMIRGGTVIVEDDNFFNIEIISKNFCNYELCMTNTTKSSFTRAELIQKIEERIYINSVDNLFAFQFRGNTNSAISPTRNTPSNASSTPAITQPSTTGRSPSPPPSPLAFTLKGPISPPRRENVPLVNITEPDTNVLLSANNKSTHISTPPPSIRNAISSTSPQGSRRRKSKSRPTSHSASQAQKILSPAPNSIATPTPPLSPISPSSSPVSPGTSPTSHYNNIGGGLSIFGSSPRSFLQQVTLETPWGGVDDGWERYDPLREYSRIGLMGSGDRLWRLTNLNKSYSVCSTYPRCFMVPSTVSDNDLTAVALFRSRGRLPVGTWRHPQTKAVLARCAQPRSGFNSRCPEDERLFEAIRTASPNTKTLYLIDARPRVNAMANALKGADKPC